MVHAEREEGIGWKKMSLFRTIVGSTLYGMNGPNSDIDYFKVYVDLSDDILLGIADQKSSSYKDSDGNDIASHEIGHVINNLLKGNINYIQGVTSPLVHSGANDVYPLNVLTRATISKNCFGSINGLAKGNYEKYIIKNTKGRHEGGLQKKINIICRELEVGIHIMDTGKIDFLNHKSFYGVEDIEGLLEDFIISKENSSLPDYPPTFPFHDYLLDIRYKYLVNK